MLHSVILFAAACAAQEAEVGVSVPVTVSGQILQTDRGLPDGSGRSSVTPGFRTVIYPSLKLGSHWFGYGAIQFNSTPYFYEQVGDYRLQREVRASVLQAYIGYSRIAKGKGITIKAGQLTSAFGSFALRYDDAQNWLIDLPVNYGYYYQPVAVTGLPGAEVDVSLGKLDARVQLTNSAPANPRKLWQSDQYPVWTVGAGFTPRQELRIGFSAYRGPYLDRNHRFFFRGEAAPRELPATAAGIDVQFARGRWNVNGELQRFQFPYIAIPYFFNTSGYAEAKFRAGPRWYLAGRAGRRSRTANLGVDDSFEAVAGFHLKPRHLLKAGYQIQRGPFTRGVRDNVIGVQYVFTFDALQAALR
jgi:hypothetical protein